MYYIIETENSTTQRKEVWGVPYTWVRGKYVLWPPNVSKERKKCTVPDKSWKRQKFLMLEKDIGMYE